MGVKFDQKSLQRGDLKKWRTLMVTHFCIKWGEGVVNAATSKKPLWLYLLRDTNSLNFASLGQRAILVINRATLGMVEIYLSPVHTFIFEAAYILTSKKYSKTNIRLRISTLNRPLRSVHARIRYRIFVFIYIFVTSKNIRPHIKVDDTPSSTGLNCAPYNPEMLLIRKYAHGHRNNVGKQDTI